MNSRHNGGPPLDDDEHGGWVAIARSMRRHPIVGFGVQVNPCDPSRGFCYSRAEAWIDLIMECRYRDGTVLNGGRRMTLKAGQLVGATSWLAQRWNWTPKTVEGFLRRLAADGMIVTFSPGVEASTDRIDPGSDQFKAGQKKGQQKGKQAQIISVCNYADFQVLPRGEGEATGVAAVLQRGSNGVADGENLTKKQGNKETKEVDGGCARECVPDVAPPLAEPSSPPLPLARPSENDRMWQAAMAESQRIKGSAAAKSARTNLRTTGELDGSQGVSLAAGKLTVANGAAAALLTDFPGVDLQAVCDRAAPEVMRISYPNFDQAMALLRKWARIVVSDARVAPAQRRSGKAGDGTYRPGTGEIAAALEEVERRGH